MDDLRAVWTTAFINNLPDSSFLYVEPGGKKDGEGKTTPRTLRHFPYKDANGKIDLPHLRNALSRIPQSNLPADVKATLTKKAQALLDSTKAETEDGTIRESLPRENLIRATAPGDFELRAAGNESMPTMFGHFAVFDRWTEIDSFFEGNFMERIAPGAFKKTFKENRDAIKVLFQHGRDPQIGNKPLGPIADLREDGTGGAYEVPLLDASYVRDLIPGLDAGLYGASFRFSVMKEELVEKPKASESNPRGLPERTIKEVRLHEFGPVTFPAYTDATAGIRSLTDDYIFDRLVSDPERLSALVEGRRLVGLRNPVIEEHELWLRGRAREEEALSVARLEDEEEEPVAIAEDGDETTPPEQPEDPAPGRAEARDEDEPTTSRKAKPATPTSRRRPTPRFRTNQEWVDWLTNKKKRK